MLSPMKRVLSVTKAEFETTKQLARSRILQVVLSLTTLVAYAMSCTILVFVAPYSPTFGAATPKYLLENIDPTFFLIFQLAVLFLIFDTSHRHERSRINEVLDAKPVSNFELVAGRVLGTALVMWLLVLTIVLLMVIVGLISELAGFNFAEPIPFASIAYLLFLDAPTTLVFWCALVVFLNSVLRLRILVFAVAAGLMVLWFVLTIKAPYSFLPLVSPSSNDFLFISDLTPELVALPTFLARTATLVFAFVLVVLAAATLKRQDHQIFAKTPLVASIAILVGIGSYGLASLMVLAESNQPTKWRNFHESAREGSALDLREVSGEVLLHNRVQLEIDLNLTFTCDSDSSTSLLFTFNPAMNILELELNGTPTSYSFQNGLLEIASQDHLEPEVDHVLRVVAYGRPNPRFAYLESAVDYMTDPNAPIRSTKLFGRESSLFTSRYIALMPGAYWYPVPGTAHTSAQGSDYFDVDLSVDLTPSNWILIGTGSTVRPTDEESTYQVRSVSSVREIGLFASAFVRIASEIDGTNVAMYLHRRHAENVLSLLDLEQAFRTEATKWLRRISDNGLTLPQRSLSLVEVPRRLRTVGGGLRMDSVAALPGVLLLKEHGFPSAPMSVALARLEERTTNTEQLKSSQIDLLKLYFELGLETDNLWTGVPKSLWSDVTSAKGPYSQALDQIALSLISSLVPTPRQFFSIHSTSYIAQLTGVNPYAVGEFSGSILSTERNALRRVSPIRSLITDHGRRIAIWDYTEKIGFSDLPTQDNQSDLELILFKSNAIARGLLSVNGETKVFGWLSDIRNQFAGKTYTYMDMLAIADEHDLVIDPFLTDWIQTTSLPGYVVSRMSVDRIADDSEGNSRYKTSVTVRNMEPSAGFVRLQFPTEQTWDWMFPYYTQSDGVLIEAESAKRINLITSYEVRTAQLLPSLSLNRGAIGLRRRSSDVAELRNVEPPPFAEDTDWVPSVEEGIIIDDLDPGFVVFQPLPDLRSSTSIGPLGWFVEPRLQVDLDRGIPTMGNYWARDSEFRMPQGTWGRMIESTAYGKYRKTVATAWVRDKIHNARFTAELPESNRWKLAYHVPRAWRPGRGLDLQWELKIFDDNQEWFVIFDLGSKTLGWNDIGVFDLEAGAVNVELVDVSEPTMIYADAIRWTKQGDS